MGGVGKVRGAWGQASFSALYARYLPKACVPTMAITHPIANQGFLFFFSFGGSEIQNASVVLTTTNKVNKNRNHNFDPVCRRFVSSGCFLSWVPTKNVAGKRRKVIISHMCPCARTCATSLLPKRKNPKLFVQACICPG